TAVVLQRAELRIDVQQIRVVEAAAAAAVTDQVVAGGENVAGEIGTNAPRILGDDGVAQGGYHAVNPAAAAAALTAHVEGDGAVGDPQGSRGGVNAAPKPMVGARQHRVAGDRAVADSQRRGIVNAAAGTCAKHRRPVPDHGAVTERQIPGV